MMIYKDIELLCRTRNKRGFIESLLETYGIPYSVKVGSTSEDVVNYHLHGTSKVLFIAHYDIYNPHYDNANDNSASVINLIALKITYPEADVVLVDKEEPPHYGLGARLLYKGFTRVDKSRPVLDVELSGTGTALYRTKQYNNDLGRVLDQNFGTHPINTPFSQGGVLVGEGINAATVFALPDGKEFECINRCHTPEDSLANVSVDDMHSFVENFLVPCLNL